MPPLLQTCAAGETANVVWYAVKRCARQAGIANLAPHDLRRTCALLCHNCNGELEQIRFLLGHASVQTTERYIGSKQKLQDAVNDRFEIGDSVLYHSLFLAQANVAERLAVTLRIIWRLLETSGWENGSFLLTIG
jgi:integrase